MLLISPRKYLNTLKKTDNKCCICGCDDESVKPTTFIPEWTRVDYLNKDNLIPMCGNCQNVHYGNFIELGKLEFLPTIYLQSTLRYYIDWSKYLYKYVYLFSETRCSGTQSKQEIINIILSYDEYVKSHKADLDWESL